MANDWIKVRTALHTDFAVLRIGRIVGQNRWEVVGRLSDIWGWIGAHSPDGKDIPVTGADIDALVDCNGFAAAMIQVGWLTGQDGHLEIPHFERHNSDSAKARALESEAKRLRRVGQVSDKCPTKTGPDVGLEKRREEKNIQIDSHSTREAIRTPPSESEVYAAAERMGVPRNVAEIFYNDCEARPLSPRGMWTNRNGDEVANWQSGLKAFHGRWQANELQRSNNKPIGLNASKAPTRPVADRERDRTGFTATPTPIKLL